MASPQQLQHQHQHQHQHVLMDDEEDDSRESRKLERLREEVGTDEGKESSSTDPFTSTFYDSVGAIRDSTTVVISGTSTGLVNIFGAFGLSSLFATTESPVHSELTDAEKSIFTESPAPGPLVFGTWKSPAHPATPTKKEGWDEIAAFHDTVKEEVDTSAWKEIQSPGPPKK